MAVVGIVGALLGIQLQAVQAQGEGTFSLELSIAAAPELATELLPDGSGYSVLEGEPLVVRVKRTPVATLLTDVTVLVQLKGGKIGIDYAPTALSPYVAPVPPALEPPDLPVVQAVTFPAGTNLSYKDAAAFLTYNRNSQTDRAFQVTILSVSGGSISTPSTAPLTLRGTFTPQVTNVFPRSGWVGTTLQVTGRNFKPGATTVDFYPVGGGPAVNATVLSATSTVLVVQVPAGLGNPAEYDIRVTVDAVTSTAVAADRFVATSGSTVTRVVPSSGPYLGGTVVTILGTSLNCTTVYFGGVQAPPATCTLTPGNYQLQIQTPARAPFPPGTVDVTVANSVQTADTKFTYTGGPVITAVTPPIGPVSGGNEVIITGSGFGQTPGPCNATFTVTFGGNPAVCTRNSDTKITAIAPTPTGPGTVQVIVTHPDGGPSAFTTAANYTYVSGPVVLGLSPLSGPPQGGTVVTITGAGFASGATVAFGTVPSPNVTFLSASKLQATAPAGAGTVDVRVTVGALTSPASPVARFSYGIPEVTSITPNAGPRAGGTAVVIKGANFTPDAKVFFGTTPAASVTFISTVELGATTPAVGSDVGEVNLQVTTPNGTNVAGDATKFTFTNGPIVASISPNTGPTQGGTVVIITGTQFAADAKVAFGATEATTLNVNSATQITVISPPVSATGTVDVRVTTSAGTSPVTVVDRFAYTGSAPVVLAVTPNTGPTAGGTTVTISGSGFLATECPSGVMFGIRPAQSCTVDSDTSITAVTPPNWAGATWVVVTTPFGSSDISKDNFTYVSSQGGQPPAPPSPPADQVSYQLGFRWTLVTWSGKDGIAVTDALKGKAGTAFNDVSPMVSAVYGWDSQGQAWRAYFPSGQGVPGANDLATLTTGEAYWVAILVPSAVTWTVEPR